MIVRRIHGSVASNGTRGTLQGWIQLIFSSGWTLRDGFHIHKREDFGPGDCGSGNAGSFLRSSLGVLDSFKHLAALFCFLDALISRCGFAGHLFRFAFHPAFGSKNDRLDIPGIGKPGGGRAHENGDDDQKLDNLFHDLPLLEVKSISFFYNGLFFGIPVLLGYFSGQVPVFCAVTMDLCLAEKGKI